MGATFRAADVAADLLGPRAVEESPAAIQQSHRGLWLLTTSERLMYALTDYWVEDGRLHLHHVVWR